jgi:hypothetical protein
MSGHHPWRGIQREREQRERWQLTVSRTYRPWWTLWLLCRRSEVTFSREGSEEEILASAADLKGQYPGWEFDLRRV